MMRTPQAVTRFALCLTAACLLSTPAAAEDWTYWRGPNMNGHSAVTNLPDEWDPEGGEGSNLVWKRTDLGSRSTPVVLNGKLYMICREKPDVPSEQREKVVCLDAATGDTLWENAFNVYLSDVPQERVGWSSVVADPETGNVYALGVSGYFQCLNGETGETVWSKSLHEEFGLLSTYGGRTNFPIIHEDNVIISGVIIGWGATARPTHRFYAFDKKNGQPIWHSGTTPSPHDTTYSGPVLGVLGGELAMVFASGDGGVHAMQPRTGKILWSYKVAAAGINLTPIIDGDRVYCGHSEENVDSTKMGALFCLDGTKRGDLMKNGGEIWRQTELFVGRSTPLLIDGKLYAVDDRAKMHVVDAESGKVLDTERLGTMMRSSPLYADGKIYGCEVNGRWFVLKPTEDGVEVVNRMRLGSGEECHGSPIAVNGRIYFPTSDAMYCIGKPDAESASEPLPELPQEADRKADSTPAQLQPVPVDSLLRPGEAQQFQVRLYNAQGQYVRMAKAADVQFSLEGEGEISESGRFHSQQDAQQHPVIVTAKVGELTGTARIRVVPGLDWSFDFDKGEVPATWVGIQYRHIVLDYDLLSKLREQDPRAADLYIYLRTAFVNTRAPAQTFDDATPAQRWRQLLGFLNLLSSADKPQTVEDAEAKLGPSLKILQDEKVLAGVEWSTWDRPTGNGDETVPEPRLKVTQGERQVDGNGVLCKITTIPLGTRSQGWMGHPDLSGYTIQADVRSSKRDERMPDIGLIGQRYTFDMMGAYQQLQIRTWTPQLDRMSVSTPFPWEQDVWYTMKFQTAVEDGKAVLRGKVWKKGEEEPAEWTITAEDAIPNVVGSPGLFGNAKDAEVFYDNLTVKKNED